jgi:hypothetical protein
MFGGTLVARKVFIEAVFDRLFYFPFGQMAWSLPASISISRATSPLQGFCCFHL